MRWTSSLWWETRTEDSGVAEPIENLTAKGSTKNIHSESITDYASALQDDLFNWQRESRSPPYR